MQVYYFTRTGRSKKVAEELAERYETKAQEIADDVNWQGAMGYLKAGYESFKKETRPARYNKPTPDEELILVFPVCIFRSLNTAFPSKIGQVNGEIRPCLRLRRPSAFFNKFLL